MVSGGWLRGGGAGAPGHEGAAVNRPQPRAGRPAAIAGLSCFSIARLMHVAVSGSPDGCLQATSATCGVHGKRWVAQGTRCGCSTQREGSSQPATATCRAASCPRGAVPCFSIARLMHVAVSASPDGCLQATSATCEAHGKWWVAQGRRCGRSRPQQTSTQPATTTCRAPSCHRHAVMLQHCEG